MGTDDTDSMMEGATESELEQADGRSETAPRFAEKELFLLLLVGISLLMALTGVLLVLN